MYTNKETNYLTPEDFQKFIDVITDKRIQLLFRVMYWAGLRVSEVISLTPRNIKEDCIVLYHTKSKKVQEATIPDKNTWDELIALSKNHKTDERLFPYCRGWMWQLGKKYGNMAGLNIKVDYKLRSTVGVYTHLFRKSIATRMLHDGASIDLVRDKLRHSNVSITDRYVRPGKTAYRKFEQEMYNK